MQHDVDFSYYTGMKRTDVSPKQWKVLQHLAIISGTKIHGVNLLPTFKSIPTAMSTFKYML